MPYIVVNREIVVSFIQFIYKHMKFAQMGFWGFIDVGWVQQYVNLYQNWQGLTNANNNYQLAATGLTARYVYDHLLVNAALALRVGQNPLYNSSGQQLNADNAYRTVQAWVRASYLF